MWWIVGFIIAAIFILPIVLWIMERMRDKKFGSTKSKSNMTQQEKDEMRRLDAEINLRKQLMQAEMKRNMDRNRKY